MRLLFLFIFIPVVVFAQGEFLNKGESGVQFDAGYTGSINTGLLVRIPEQ